MTIKLINRGTEGELLLEGRLDAMTSPEAEELVDAIFVLSLQSASTHMASSHCLAKTCPVETGEWGSHSLTKAGGHMQSTREMPLIT